MSEPILHSVRRVWRCWRGQFLSGNPGVLLAALLGATLPAWLVIWLIMGMTEVVTEALDKAICDYKDGVDYE